MTHTNAEPAGICSQCGEPFGEHSCVPIPSCIHVGQFPADDVREALSDIIRGGSYSRFPGDLPYADVVDRILSDPRFEVRPHGTVTDAEARFVRAFSYLRELPTHITHIPVNHVQNILEGRKYYENKEQGE